MFTANLPLVMFQKKFPSELPHAGCLVGIVSKLVDGVNQPLGVMDFKKFLTTGCPDVPGGCSRSGVIELIDKQDSHRIRKVSESGSLKGTAPRASHLD